MAVEFQIPGSWDGILGTAGSEHVSQENPLGVNPEDPYGQDDIIRPNKGNALPLNQPVHLLLRSEGRTARLHRRAISREDGFGTRYRNIFMAGTNEGWSL